MVESLAVAVLFDKIGQIDDSQIVSCIVYDGPVCAREIGYQLKIDLVESNTDLKVSENLIIRF